MAREEAFGSILGKITVAELAHAARAGRQAGEE
jgi:hypothetical protein